MSKHEELRLAFAEYTKSERDFVGSNEIFADLIVGGLREYLAMPTNYLHKTRDGTAHKSYTPVYRVDDDGSTSEESFLQDAITHLTDGSFRFAFAVTLDIDEKTFPKKCLILSIECKRLNDIVTVSVADTTVDCTFDGVKCESIERVHEMIFRLVLGWLKHRPADGHGYSKIGFKMGSQLGSLDLQTVEPHQKQ